MPLPTIGTVIATISAAVEAIDGYIHPTIGFVAVEIDPRDVAVGSVERAFRLKFLGLVNASDEGRGVIVAGIDDREASFALEVGYPMLDARDEDAPLERQIASDTELVHRALTRRSWPGTSIARVAVSTSREDVEEAGIVVAIHSLTVQYRDSHQA